MAIDVLRLSADDHNWNGPLALCEFTLKFRYIFRYEFQGIVQMDGKCPENLFKAMTDVADMWCTNTQEIEGANNIVKSVGKVAPNISWELMSSRVVSKKVVCRAIVRLLFD